MKTDAAFSATDLGLTVADLDISVKTKAGVIVDTSGWSMTESQRGVYEVDVPLMVVPGTIYLVKKTDPTVFYDGFMDYGASVIDALNTMLEIDGATYRYTANALEQGPNTIISGLTQAIYDYITGKIAKGTIIAPLAEATAGKPLNIFQYTSYETPGEILINVGADFAPWLDGTYDPWFTASSFSNQPVPDMDAICTIYNQAAGQLKLALTVAQTSIDPGTYKWQIQLRTPDGVKVHVTAEGRLEMKPTLRKP
jgi:hypothetical protein